MVNVIIKQVKVHAAAFPRLYWHVRHVCCMQVDCSSFDWHSLIYHTCCFLRIPQSNPRTGLAWRLNSSWLELADMFLGLLYIYVYMYLGVHVPIHPLPLRNGGHEICCCRLWSQANHANTNLETYIYWILAPKGGWRRSRRALVEKVDLMYVSTLRTSWFNRCLIEAHSNVKYI